MREYTTPMTVEVAETGNLTDDVVRHARETPERALFARRTQSSDEAGWTDVTAAAFHDIPLVGVDARRVHTIPFGDNPSKTHRDVVRHKIPLRAGDVTIRDGLWVTSLDRTLFDLVRRLRFEPALAAMCAAIAPGSPSSRKVRCTRTEGSSVAPIRSNALESRA